MSIWVRFHDATSHVNHWNCFGVRWLWYNAYQRLHIWRAHGFDNFFEIVCEERSFHTAAIPHSSELRIKVSVIGGSDGSSTLSSVERYSPDEGQWEHVTAMQSQRCYSAAAVLNGKIYVCGGFVFSSSRFFTLCLISEFVFFLWNVLFSSILIIPYIMLKQL